MQVPEIRLSIEIRSSGSTSSPTYHNTLQCQKCGREWFDLPFTVDCKPYTTCSHCRQECDIDHFIKASWFHFDSEAAQLSTLEPSVQTP